MRDATITELLTADVVKHVFTSGQDVVLIRNTGNVTLKDAIYHAFSEGLETLKFMTANERNMSPEIYGNQKKAFTNNTMAVVRNLEKAAEVEIKEVPQEPTTKGLVERFERIAATIRIIKQNKKSKDLLHVLGYTTENMRAQVEDGFGALKKS